MNKSTREVRFANWKTIVEQCNIQPQETTVKQWIAFNVRTEDHQHLLQKSL